MGMEPTAPPVGHAAPGRPRRSWHRPALSVAAGLATLWFALEAWWVLTPGPAVRHAPAIVEIPAHRGSLEVAHLLRDAGVVNSARAFILLTAVRGSVRSLKAGEYQVPQGGTTLVVLRLLESGQVVQHSVVLREGSTVAELARELEAEHLASAEDVLAAARDPAFLRSQNIEAANVEGYLFPDTYQLVKGMTATEILGKMVARMRERLSPEIVGSARARDVSVHQVLTMASIIEKEAVERSEMPLISAVFWNRLRLEMPLQADPTVQYALGKDRQRLSREDLLTDSPFNTYRRPGLPPGPIASPSLPAIEAAVNPAHVSYLYFVATGEDRRHTFTSTLAEHNAAVARYRVARTR